MNTDSLYRTRPDDPEAVYFTPQNYEIRNDGTTDVSEALQEAIRKVKFTSNYGIVFIPEGLYAITKTVFIPKAVRLIGYGEKRPRIVLGANSSGFQTPDPADKGNASYMFWFVRELGSPGEPIGDADAGTFYSAICNIDLEIGAGNPCAVALRTHFAQNCFISHSEIHIGQGRAGIFDAGNIIHDVHFRGGDYGIITTKTSPGWPFVMLDTLFEGQRRAAVLTREAGLTVLRMTARDTPAVIEIEEGQDERLYMEDCRFEDIPGAGVIVSKLKSGKNHVCLENIACSGVPSFVRFRESGAEEKGPAHDYTVRRYIYGQQVDGLDAVPEFRTTRAAIPSPAAEAPASDIQVLPDTAAWVNLKALGAKGDGVADDTPVLLSAIEHHRVIYLPQGMYRVSATLRLKPDTVLIGLNPISTQLLISDHTDAFGGFGPPVPLLEAPKGGTNIVSGLGLNTGHANPRASACKWMAGEQSLLDDIKILGGHGNMPRDWQAPRKYYRYEGFDPCWDTQYWSLWITDGGAGVFRNIWTASTFATSGLYVSDTAARGRIYAVSVEHHFRNEVRFSKIANWKIYGLQLEEEELEGAYCQPMDIVNSDCLVFANLYLFRTIRVKTPYPYAVRTWNCRDLDFFNIYNYAQVRFTFDNSLYDVGSDRELRPWELTYFRLPGGKRRADPGLNGMVRLAQGFEFAEGICRDSRGNIYFSEFGWKRIYRWSPSSAEITLVSKTPWEPMALACDSLDKLLVVFKYKPLEGRLVNGTQETFANPEDAEGTSFSKWGNSGYAVWVYSMDPEQPDETIALLKKVRTGTVKDVRKALYPAHRWRDSLDYQSVTLDRPAECWLAPDGATVIPVCYDLARTSSLVEAYPGQTMYAADEYGRMTYRFDVDADGCLSGLSKFADQGEFSCAVSPSGDVYIAEGDIFRYGPDGKLKNSIRVPERPTGLVFGGQDGGTLYITTRSGFYSYRTPAGLTAT